LSSPSVHPSLVTRRLRALLSLNLPVFVASACGGIIMLAMPYEIHRLGGSAAAMGAVGGILTATYICACVLLSPKVDRFDPRTLVQMGLGLQAIMVCLIALAPAMTWTLIAAGLFGILPSLIWPPVMGWISTGHEGADLNRRLSLFNLSWSSGMVLGPVAGGLMYEVHHALPFFSAAALLVLGTLVVRALPSPRAGTVAGTPRNQEPLDDVNLDGVATFRPLARIALLLSYMVMGIFRYQLPSLALVLKIRTGLVGAVMMSLGVAMAASFYLLGRTHRWHYRFSVFFGAQVVMACSVLSLILIRTWWQMALCVVVGGICVGVTYTSNLFYGVSGGQKRARLMIIHEVLLSVGTIIGSSGGGWVTDHVTLRAAYPIGSALVITGIAVQLLLLLRRRLARVPPPLPVDGTGSVPIRP
jgi:MFS family permease